MEWKVSAAAAHSATGPLGTGALELYAVTGPLGDDLDGAIRPVMQSNNASSGSTFFTPLLTQLLDYYPAYVETGHNSEWERTLKCP
jgi:hypothetical protein